MKVLFIGGTGIISSACSRLAVERGIELTLFNRGQASRPIPKGARVIQGDIHDPVSVRNALQDQSFDVVVNWIVFTPEQIEADIGFFRGRTGQYIFISSASVYQTPPASLPVTESTLLDNPYWAYSRAKIACEMRLVQAYREEQFPVTIVRPSHTYDKTLFPFRGGYTIIDRMLKGKPVVVHGDGTSVWVLTHHKDFAWGFTGLLGNYRAIGEVFHITADEWLTWNQIYQVMARAAGSKARLVHIPSETIAAFDADWGASLLGDKSHSMIFDNSKIKRFVPDFSAKIPFSQGAEEILAWYAADPSRQAIDPVFDGLLDRMLAAYQGVFPREEAFEETSH